MKINKTYWKGDYIYLLPNIAIYIETNSEKAIYIKLSFLKFNLGLYIIWKEIL